MIQTERLILRQWCDEDLAPFAAMNSDPEVRRYFPSLLSREESDSSAKALARFIQEQGWGFWAAALVETGQFIGFIGLQEVGFDAPFTPAVEIGWRLEREFWGRGYATEGALAALRYGFLELELPEIISFTTPENSRSIAVMKKIGMRRDPADDFDHPRVAEKHPLRRHLLYRMAVNDWRATNSG